MNEITHHGILGQRWGVRRYQNSDGSLTSAGRKRLEKKDTKWVKKNEAKVKAKVGKVIKKDLSNYVKNELNPNVKARNSDGKLSKQYINAYNQKMANLMNENVGNVRAPSGRVVRFVAKRGEVGVFTALADQNYNMSELQKGLHSSGRIAYRKKTVNKVGGGS